MQDITSGQDDARDFRRGSAVAIGDIQAVCSHVQNVCLLNRYSRNGVYTAPRAGVSSFPHYHLGGTQMNRPRILIVVTSHNHIDDQHETTGLWFEEFAVPYRMFTTEGYAITVTSPLGGEAPIDYKSLEGYNPCPENEQARSALRNTRRLDAGICAADYEAVFFPGGHGTMFDLPDNPEVQRLIGEFASQDKVIASVCHGPACLVGARHADGTALVQGRRLTAFTDSEEKAVALDEAMPFLLESRLRELGAEFVPAADWSDHIVVDGKLVTGQNPQSSGRAAQAVIELLS